MVQLNVKAIAPNVVSAEIITRTVITQDVLKCVRNADQLGVMVDVHVLNAVKLNAMVNAGVQSVIR